jgi:hypothetical protein
VLKSLRLLLVLHGEDKVQVGLVVHLALVGEALLEASATDSDPRSISSWIRVQQE